MVTTRGQRSAVTEKEGAAEKVNSSKGRADLERGSSNAGLPLMLAYAVLLVLPWTLLVAPYVSSSWREQVHKSFVDKPLSRLFGAESIETTTSYEQATCDSASPVSTSRNDNTPTLINANRTLLEDEPAFLEVGSFVEVADEVEDAPEENSIVWYRGQVIGVEGADTFRIHYEMDGSEEVVGRNQVRPYAPPKQHNILQVFMDGVFYLARIHKVHDDATTFDVYVQYYGQVVKNVSAGLLRRFEPKVIPTFTVEPNTSIHQYLNPKLLEDPSTLEKVGERLRAGELVIIRDAFRPEFAEAMHYDLSTNEDWGLFQVHSSDGFHYHHHNIYDAEDYSELMNTTYKMFDHPDTKAWAEGLTGKDCSGEVTGSPSYYMPGDYSMPHTDFKGERTVAYVWHLSKNWRPEWGGALYWCPEVSYDAFNHASFNTLSLFVVTPRTMHFVTGVTEKAMDKRLTFNGWWNSEYEPSIDDPIEEMFATPEQRKKLSRDPFDWILEIDLEELAPERREKVAEIQRELTLMEYPADEEGEIFIVDPEGRLLEDGEEEYE